MLTLALLSSPAVAATDVLYCVDYAIGTDRMAAALAALPSTYNVTTTSSMTDCETYISAGTWEIVIVFIQNRSYSMPQLESYVGGGGRAILADWTRNSTRAAAFGASYTSYINATSLNVGSSLSTGVVTNPITLTNPGWGRFSMVLTAGTGSTAAATLGIDSGIVIGNGGRTVINGFLSDTGPADLTTVFTNEIASIVATMDACDSDGDGYDSASCSGADCDDGNRKIYPGATETCDGADQDCDGTIDDGVRSTWYRDADGDSWGDAGTVLFACSLPSGYLAVAGDCDDTSAAVSPSATEACNGRDDDCDGTIDDGVTATWFEDADADGHGDPDSTTESCSSPLGYAADGDDCDDTSDAVHPDAAEVCDEVDNDCDDLVDEGTKSTFYADSDGDTYGDAATLTSACEAPSGYSADATDCNDASSSIHPGATEVCDGLDDDCDSLVDEGVTSAYYADSDRDGYGDATVYEDGCGPSAGWVADRTDCDDAAASVHPGASEVCDGADSDCDGAVDDGVLSTFYLDDDGDHFGVTASSVEACAVPAGYAADEADCDDTDDTIHPGAGEACDGEDDDCNGVIDDGVTSAWYADADGDGYGDAADAVDECAPPSGYVADDADCDDAVDTTHPDAEETCNTVDDDCDGDVDEDAVDPAEWHPDADADGFGDPADQQIACFGPADWVDDGTDCDDTDATVYPDAAEIPYDGVDQSCDGSDVADADADGFDAEAAGGDDCDDFDDTVYAGATEIADGKDNDCDGRVDEGTDWTDDDGDGFAEAGGDCDDTTAERSPALTETCDDLDNDCDGIVDDGTPCVDDDGDGLSEDEGDCDDADAAIHPGGTEDPANGRDDDCDGTTDGGTTDSDHDGYAVEAGDCKDLIAEIHPGAPETPNGLDDDCDGLVDEGTDSYDDDGDGFTERDGDCDDGTGTTYPEADEIAGNGRDDDCDGELDEGGTYVDDDNDGFSEAEGDCNDIDPGAHPGADEVENGRDDDCDGDADEGLLDHDDDGFTFADGDCDDENGWMNPAQPEVLDGLDNDCDGRADDGLLAEEPDVDPPVPCGCATPGSPSAILGLLALFLRRRVAAGRPGDR